LTGQGDVTHLIFEGRDVTDRKRAETVIRENSERVMVLSEISEGLLDMGTDYPAILRTVAGGTARLIGDASIVSLLSDDGETLVSEAWSHRNPARCQAVGDILGSMNRPARGGLEGDALASGRILRASLTDGEDGEREIDPEWRLRLRAMEVEGLMIAPLCFQGRPAGILAVLRDRTEKPFDEHDLELLRLLAHKASQAIQNARLFAEVCAQRLQLQALSRKLVKIQEAERSHIARELHDEAGQTLTSLMVALRLLEREAHRPEAVISGIAEMKRTLDAVLKNLHRLGMDLRPVSLDHLGLVAALRQHVQSIANNHGIDVQFESLLTSTRFSSDVEISLYRIVQEALTNVIRHADATQVDVLLEQRADRIILVVEDNGVGFDLPSAMNNGRLGLFGMRERVEMLAGKLNIESAPGKGTTVQVEVPYCELQNPDR
ncbi:MAG: GAF domain-containing sensor histidine kinase, partial [Syntrophobacteraceae bacterium]|nr:GAF domain-containing sensor histidine kinase [Syntrophobacteraceae bacterium]